MKVKKQVAKVLIMSLLMMTFSLTTFADVTETNEEVTVIDEVTVVDVVDVVEEVEHVNATIEVNLGYNVLLTVDEFGVIISAEIIEEEPVLEEPVLEEPVVEEPVVEEPVVEEPVVEEPVVEETVVEETIVEVPVVEVPVVEEPVVEVPVVENQLTLLIGSTLTEGIQMLVDAIEADEDFDFEVVISSDDDEYAVLSELLYTAFGDAVEIESEEALNEQLNPNFERFANAILFGITNGKMNLLEKLGVFFKEDSPIDYSEWATKAVKEVMSEIKSYKKGLKSEDKVLEEEEEEDNQDAESKNKSEIKNKSEVKAKSENKGKGKDNNNKK